MTALAVLAALLPQGTAQDLLGRAEEALKETRTLRFTATSTITGRQGTTVQRAAVTLRRPNLARVEREMKGVDMGLVVFDGETGWLSIPSAKQYLKMPVGPGPALFGMAGPLPLLFYGGDVGAALGNEAELAVERRTREGTEFDVVIAKVASPEAEFRFWLDAGRALRRYEVRHTGKGTGTAFDLDIAYGAVERDPEIADDTFTFTPPEGATEVRPGGFDESALVEAGRPAPAFEAADLEGRPVKLADFRGKTVVLNFWFYH